MDVTPREAPVYGGGGLTATISRPALSPQELQQTKFYLVFTGSRLRHVTAAKAVWLPHCLTLKGYVPAHDQPEKVSVSAFASQPTGPRVLATARFQFTADAAFQTAALLSRASSDAGALGSLEHLCTEHFQATIEARLNFDKCLTRAFKALLLPIDWVVAGCSRKAGSSPSHEARETLLHFCARLGLKHLAGHLLSLPGSKDALNTPNRDGLIPEELACRSGFTELADALARVRRKLNQTASSDHVGKSLMSQKWPPVVTTNLSWNFRDIDYDIAELERLLQELAHKSKSKKQRSSFSKRLSGSEGEVSDDDSRAAVAASQQRVIPEIKVLPSTPTPKSRVLENNLRRLHGIHQGIQNLRKLNAWQLLSEGWQKKGSNRLSTSCPSLITPGGENDEPRGLLYSLRQAAVMSGQSTDPAAVAQQDGSPSDSGPDLCSIKIRVNDLTPSNSQEFLHLSDSIQGIPHGCEGNTQQQTQKSQDIAEKKGASSDVCLPKNGRDSTRRKSWSAVAQASRHADDQLPATFLHRSHSLSSLNSELEEAIHLICSRKSSFPVRGVALRKAGLSSSTECLHMKHGNHLGKDSFGWGSGSLLLFGQSLSNILPSDISEVGGRFCSKQHRSSSSASEEARLVPPRSTLQKSISTPSILDVQVTRREGSEESSDSKAGGHAFNCAFDDERIRTMMLEEDDEEPEELPYFYSSQLSLAEFLRESQIYLGGQDSDEDKPFGKRKKRGSLFFRKRKSKDKDAKKSPHQFVSVCYSTAAVCDVCSKPLANKPALSCENCMVTVHASSCKDQIVDCTKFRTAKGNKPSQLQLAKERVQGQEVYISQGSGKVSSPVLPSKEKKSGDTPGSQPQTPTLLIEGVARALSSTQSRVICEEKEADSNTDDTLLTYAEIISASVESLDEGAQEISDLEDDPSIRLVEDEPETWNTAVDKKVLKKLKERDIKRQEAIYEFIITEKHHCLTLKIMQKMFAKGMIKELGMTKDMVERIFPCIDDLLDVHVSFLRRLRERQSKDAIVENIGDLLLQQFEGQAASRMQAAYGTFCSSHKEALSLYKDILKSDRKFQNFVKKCSLRPLCKARGIPECILLVTQRVTKYPLLIDSLLKTTKDNKSEHEVLHQVLASVKDIINRVDAQVAEKERKHRLLEIYNKVDAKSTAFLKGKKFKKSDLLSNNRKLRYEGSIAWKNARGKITDVIAVVLSDVIFFMQENNQKYFFASLDSKSGVVSLQKLLVREKAGQGSRGIYLISSNPSEPEMYELICTSAKIQKQWISVIREAVEHCPVDDESAPSESEGRKLEEARTARLKQLILLMHEKDLFVAHLCEEKMQMLLEILELLGAELEIPVENLRYTHLLEQEDGQETKEMIFTAVAEASQLASTLYASGTNLCRSVSSAGEHQSETFVSPILPKRAETFGGFDNPTKEQVAFNKVMALKKRLLHLKDLTGESSMAGKEQDAESRESPESYLYVKGTESRRSSGPLLSGPSSGPGSPEKQAQRSGSAAGTPSPRGSVVGEMLTLTTTPLLFAQGKDQLLTLLELTHHLHMLTCLLAHHFTSVESWRVQSLETQDKLFKASKDGRDKRPLYRPEHQLEELRNLQEQLSRERAQWQQEQAEQQAALAKQQEELRLLQEQVKAEQEDVTHQRELLYRKLEALQKEGIVLSSTLSIVGDGTLRKDSEPSADCEYSKAGEDSEGCTSADGAQHRRCVSFDIQQLQAQRDGAIRGTDSQQNPEARLARSSLPMPGKRDARDIVPLHLCSATNMQKRPTVSAMPIKQQLPLKLASGSSALNGLINNAGRSSVTSKLSGSGGRIASSICSPQAEARSWGSAPNDAAGSPTHTRTGSMATKMTLEAAGEELGNDNVNSTDREIFC